MTAFAAAALAVFLRAIQQMNVVGGHYLAAWVTAFAIAAADVLVIVEAVDGRLAAVPWIGAGGAVGVTTAMWVHRRLTK